MSLVVNTNIASLNSQRNLGISNSQLSKSLEKLSSGLRINKAADDAAGLAIATKFGAQVRGLNQAVRNANNAISLVNTAEGGVNTLTNVLQRLRELAVQSASDDNTTSDRATLTSEADNLLAEFTRISTTTEFNTMALLDGSFTGRYFQVGANYSQSVTFSLGDARGKALGGRAQFDADVVDGVANAVDSNFTSSELQINGTYVAATADADDQYSVLEMSGTALAVTAAGGNISDVNGGVAAVSMLINNTAVQFNVTSGMLAISVVDVVVSAINAAGITNVSAVELNSDVWALRAKGGTNLELAVYSTGAGAIGSLDRSDTLSILGLTAMSTMFGSAALAASDIVNYNGQSSAIAKAAAINTVKTSTGVTATVRPTVVTANTAVVAGNTISSGQLFINGTDMGEIVVNGIEDLIVSINNKSSDTGVSASNNGSGKLVLTASDGRNISVTAANTTILTSWLGLAGNTGTTAIYRSTIRLTSESDIKITGTLGDLYDAGTSATGTGAGNDATETTDASKTVTSGTATYNVKGIEIDTKDNAEAAILTIDAALNDLNNLRSQIGAVQNRIEFTVSNLETASENMSASQSRIMDADFAFETAKFTRNQILVQAGTAMLAQANTLQQVALQLLK